MAGDLHLVYYLRDESINTRGGKEREERNERGNKEGGRAKGEGDKQQVRGRTKGSEWAWKKARCEVDRM